MSETSNGLDFLDELATPSQDEATPVADSITASAAGPDTTVPETAPAEGNSEDGPKYPNVLNTLPEGSEIPENYFTIADWSKNLTVRNVLPPEAGGKGMGADGVVDKNAVYAATKAVRNPLPVVLVGDTVYLGPEAVEAWDARPVRGEGAGSTGGQLSDEDLLKAAARARSQVTFLKGRLASISDRLNKATTLQEKRSKQLTARNMDWVKVDEWESANEEVLPDEDGSKSE